MNQIIFIPNFFFQYFSSLHQCDVIYTLTWLTVLINCVLQLILKNNNLKKEMKIIPSSMWVLFPEVNWRFVKDFVS